jgi:hypothetical protein
MLRGRAKTTWEAKMMREEAKDEARRRGKDDARGSEEEGERM